MKWDRIDSWDQIKSKLDIRDIEGSEMVGDNRGQTHHDTAPPTMHSSSRSMGNGVGNDGLVRRYLQG